MHTELRGASPSASQGVVGEGEGKGQGKDVNRKAEFRLHFVWVYGRGEMFLHLSHSICNSVEAEVASIQTSHS